MTSADFSLQGKVAIVTGGGRGIGRAIALAVAEAGADVTICSRSISDLEKVADEIRQMDRKALTVVADVTKRGDVENLVNQSMKEFGTIDILVNNAGIVIVDMPILETKDEEWDKVIETNLKSCHICSQVAGRIMVEAKRGSIINVSSGLAFRALQGRGVYSVAKAGVVTLTNILALELGPYNVRVNCIAPGLVRTTAVASSLRNQEHVGKIEINTPLRRIGETEDCAKVVVFLASDASGFVTGQTIFVDGGRHIT